MIDSQSTIFSDTIIDDNCDLLICVYLWNSLDNITNTKNVIANREGIVLGMGLGCVQV
jgi:hypothetical protein